MAAHGVTDLCLTPHLRAGQLAAAPPRCPRRGLRGPPAAAPDAAPAAPWRGGDARPAAPPERRGLAPVTIGGTRYMLVEFPRMVAYDTVVIALGRVVDAGLLPLLAHPERYTCCSPEAVGRWRELGARMQVDATTLLSTQSRGQRARALVAAGLADILAADNHGDDRTIATGRRLPRGAGRGRAGRAAHRAQSARHPGRRAALAGAAGRDPADLDAADPPAPRGRMTAAPGQGRTRGAGPRGARQRPPERAGRRGRRPLRRDAPGGRHHLLLRQRWQRGGRPAHRHRVRGALRGVPRGRSRPLALTTDSSLLTAAANDLGFEQVFARQVEALCRPRDLLVLHSTSGESPNLIAAARAARERSVGTVAFLGRGGGALARAGGRRDRGAVGRHRPHPGHPPRARASDRRVGGGELARDA